MKKIECTFVILLLVLGIGTVSVGCQREPEADSTITFYLDLQHNRKLQEYKGDVSSREIIPRKKILLLQDTQPEPICSVYDINTGKETCRIKRNRLKLLRVSSDEQRCVILYNAKASDSEQNFDYRIGLFDLETGKEIKNWPSIQLDNGNTSNFQGYFSPNGKHFIILMGTSPNCKALVIESDSGKTVSEYQTGYFRPLAISEDHRFVALSTPKRHTTYLDLDLNQTKEFPYYPFIISGNGKYILASNSQNETQVFFDADNGEIKQEFQELDIGMCSIISIAPDCKTIWNNSKLWSVESGKAIATVKRRQNAFYSPNGKFIYLYSGTLLDATTGNLIWDLDKKKAGLAYSDKSESLLLRDGTIMSTSDDKVISRINDMLWRRFNPWRSFNPWHSFDENKNGVLCSVSGNLKYVGLQTGKALFSMKESDFLPSRSYKADSYIESKESGRFFVTYRREISEKQK